MKKIVSAVLVFVMMLSLAGCGISYDDIKGDWTAKTINGMTIDEYGKSNAKPVVQVHPSGVMWDFFEYISPLLEKD